MAASLLNEGRTIHSLLHIGIAGKKGEDSSQRKRNKPLPDLAEDVLLVLRETFKKCMLLLVDEASMIDPILLFHMDTRLRQIMGSQRPFGGLPTLLVGDYFQLKPVRSTAFFTAAMNTIPV
jgi:ATP-dependent exoDNAse (exonuclease V) alpha subunit